MNIEDYALIGDCQGAGLVGKDGSIDWLCLPRFDSPACFANLIGTPDNGRWIIAPAGEIKSTHRRYVGDTLVLETTFVAEGGECRLIDFMPMPSTESDVSRIVQGVRGEVPMRMEFVIRPDYGSTVPWVRRTEGGITAITGPDMFRLRAPMPLQGKDFATVAEFSVHAGERLAFDLTWHPSHLAMPAELDVEESLTATIKWWEETLPTT